ncbi:DNA-binding IclR family transcriptional regulator [Microbacterium halimionae]|uniref:Glycerol operon regulatory protein n=1 Tax=Microbacterium halimionae TaxID=1526413 RepID=A0A7W3JPW4_9MICO|nr:IclR family transcriptional regulator [Microbacterium halimionae]MBA8816781.1 DNA-binding IclR family transcriptional regulator [Microbacterium halimionae]NII94923.1 DNA-binding IclR family transcriptional regulator [Microbacterium halimionae]
MSADKSTNQSVEKAVAVLESFSDGQPLRVGDVARAAHITQSTASRLLATLESAGLVERDPLTSLYFLGAELLTLAGVAINENPIHRAGRQIAQDLAFELGLGVNLAVRRGAELVYLCNFEGRRSPKSHTLMGQRVPLHATSIGKSALVGLTSSERRALVLTAYTEFTITEPVALDREAAVIARRGYATEVEEFVLGRASVAAGIVDQRGRVMAAISISGPRTTIDLEHTQDELGRIAIEKADRISSVLGYHGPRAQ